MTKQHNTFLLWNGYQIDPKITQNFLYSHSFKSQNTFSFPNSRAAYHFLFLPKSYSVCSLVVPRLEEAILTPVLKKNFKRPLILGQEGHNYPPKHSNLSYDQFGVRLEQSDTAPPFSLLAGEILILSAGFVLFSTVVFLGDLEIYFFVPVSGH